MSEKELASIQDLPIDSCRANLEAALEKHQNLVLTAEPGAGKTTRFPVMLDQFLKRMAIKGQIIVLEPRRVAARAAALRIASENSRYVLGESVGYSVRFDHRMKDETSIAFLTEGLFLQKLKSNPKLNGVSAVILDEFHERSRHTDLAIGLLAELQSLERPDLRIVAMSATMDAEKVAEFLATENSKPPIVAVPGRTHPVDVIYTAEPLRVATDGDWIERVQSKIARVLRGEDRSIGDVLVFLPGVGEIRRLKERFIDRKDCEVFELHGQLTLEEQSHVLRKSASGPKRLILSTNIAETSVTIDGVGTVIDTGLARTSRLDRLGFPQLVLERISKSSVKQRGGRAGRQFPGVNHRLWSRLDENSFPEFDEPELFRTELSEVCLELIGVTSSDPRTFTWYESPPLKALEDGLSLLQDLGAIESRSQLTAIGRRMLSTHTHPRAARLLVEEPADLSLRALLATLLTERDFLRLNRDGQYEGCDLHRRAEYFFSDARPAHTGSTMNSDVAVDRSALRLQKQVLERWLGRQNKELTSAIWDEAEVERLLLLAFPDRVCRRRSPRDRRAKMVGGRGIELSPNSGVIQSELFFALRGDAGTSRTSNDPIATMASPLSMRALEQSAERAKDLSRARSLAIVESTGTVYQTMGLVYRDLPLEDGHRDKVGSDDALPLMIAWSKSNRDKIQSSPPLQSLKSRMLCLAKMGALAVSDQSFTQAFEESLEEALYGETRASALVDEAGASRLYETMLRKLEMHSPGLARKLETEAPLFFTAPTGNRFRIDYEAQAGPTVEIRIQELFGLNAHPLLAGGRVRLILSLLSPGFRPVQVTSDLTGFWKGSYFEVRKELRSRYPKHSWPEDPANAKPEAKGRRH